MFYNMRLLILIFTLFNFAECLRISPRQSGILKKDYLKTRSSRRADVFESLFIYDPSYLSVMWPKLENGVHVSVNHSCWSDMKVFLKDLAEGRAWAYRAVDASGRYQAGLFEGNTYWLGSKQECLRLDRDFITRDVNNTLDEFQSEEYLNEVLRREKYFDSDDDWRSLVQEDELLKQLVAADNCPPGRMAYSAVQLALNVTKFTMAKSYDVTLGICLPRTCSTRDVVSILNLSIMISDNLRNNKTLQRTAKISSLRRVEDHFDITSDFAGILLICVTALLIALAVLATLLDLGLIKCRAHISKSMSFDIQRYTTTDSRVMNNSDRKFKEMLSHKSHFGTETLTINNMNNSNNINMVTIKKVVKPNAVPPSITLDVVSAERANCKRCGKYKRQCSDMGPNEPKAPCLPSKNNPEVGGKCRVLRFIVLSFSLKYSWNKLFSTRMANKDLSVVHVLKIIAIFWIMFVHVAMVVNFMSENGGDVNDHNNMYYILASGTLAFDTLFFVSGLFSAHHFFYLKSQYTVEQLVSFGGACGQILQFVCFVTNRAIRLLPSYAYVILVSSVVDSVLRQVAVVSLPGNDRRYCAEFWWRNLLYITTAYPREETCLQISWYLSVETQLHVMGALLCCAGAGGRRALAAAVAAVAVVVATTADVCGAYEDIGRVMSDVFDASAIMIERPWARVAPYFTGMLAGWVIQRVEGSLDISKTASCCLWVSSVCVLVASALLPRLPYGWLLAWTHVTWPLALFWPVLVCSTTHAGALRGACGPAVAGAGRAGLGALLLLPAAARALPAAATPHCATLICYWVYFCGAASVTCAGAVLLALFVEMPCCNLLRGLSGAK